MRSVIMEGRPWCSGPVAAVRWDRPRSCPCAAGFRRKPRRVGRRRGRRRRQRGIVGAKKGIGGLLLAQRRGDGRLPRPPRGGHGLGLGGQRLVVRVDRPREPGIRLGVFVGRNRSGCRRAGRVASPAMPTSGRACLRTSGRSRARTAYRRRTAPALPRTRRRHGRWCGPASQGPGQSPRRPRPCRPPRRCGPCRESGPFRLRGR